MQTPHRVAIYCRLSYAPDGSVEKVERQEADCRALADRLVWPIAEDHIYSDNSRSAWQRNRKRPRWDALLEALRTELIDGVIVYHGDRLIRQPWDLELLLQIADDRKIQLASPSGVRDLASEDDRFILRIEAAQACRSSADTSRRVKRGWKARAERGLPASGGKRAFGFEDDGVTQREHEVRILREAIQRIIAGQSIGGAARWMNTLCRTSMGNRWDSTALRHHLQAPRTAGLIVRGQEIYEAAWEPIISPEEWENLKAILESNKYAQPFAGRERRHLLTGIAQCHACGSKARAKPVGGRNRKSARLYYCWNEECPNRVARNVEHLDRYVAGRVLRRLQDPKLMDQVLGSEPGVAQEIVALERRRAETKAAFKRLADHPDLDPEDLADSLAGFTRRITELRSQQAATSRQRLISRMAGITQEQWDATPVDIQAATVRALYRVVILPATWRGPGFDPKSVRLDPIKG
ncbi:hypothetical protein DP939_02110 [Spongiactinospora rosea]|uniref:DNA invertase Pin-like site-specific DNA recombinase n=1 Tax=Spongiactinospora rosea TaxID=2248750 RepID=A0A366M7F0_9ACTN|nr:recombinase family protein [Spongiactinospora rosea]RBQ21524.1 hypothetical protein DP939_02110 [Spongiactinospora rosea]